MATDPGPFLVLPFTWAEEVGPANAGRLDRWPLAIPAMSVVEARVVASSMYSLCTGWRNADSLSKAPPFMPPGAIWAERVLHAHAIGRIAYRVRNVFMGSHSPGAYLIGRLVENPSDPKRQGPFSADKFALEAILRLHRARAVSAWGKFLRVSKDSLDEWLAAQCLVAEDYFGG